MESVDIIVRNIEKLKDTVDREEGKEALRKQIVNLQA